MHILKHQSNLSGIEHRMIAGKFILSSEVCEQLTTGDVVHQEEQIPRILCESSEANLKISVSQITYKEGMINVSEDGIL